MKNFRKAALSTVCMLMVAIMTLTGATYAWFTAGETATVNGMKMEVSAATGGVQVRAETSTGNWTNWASTVDLQIEKKAVEPVSSKDGENFFNVSFNPEDATQYKTLETGSGQAIIQKLQLKNPGNGDIQVNINEANSAITSIKNETTGVTTAINDAVRIALIVTKPTGDKQTYIWAPNDSTYYPIVAASADYVTENNTAVISGITEMVNITDGADCLITLPGINAETGAETFVDVTIVVWLEGQDADCQNKNAAGAFDIQLQFALVKAAQS